MDVRNYASEHEFHADIALMKRGDFVGVSGHPCT
jgi:hypothetical protein